MGANIFRGGIYFDPRNIFIESRSSSGKSATGRKNIKGQDSCGHKEATSLTNNKLYIQMRNTLSVATWNVQGLKTHTWKLAIIEKELSRYKIDIAGLSETHWIGQVFFKTSLNNYVYFSSADQQNFTGVAVIVSEKLQKYVLDFKAISDRIMALKLNARLNPINIVQVYAPTAASGDIDIDHFYHDLRSSLQNIPNKELTIVTGDFNAKIGDTTDNEHIKTIVGKYGIGVRNERGERLLDFAIENNLTITNTTF